MISKVKKEDDEEQIIQKQDIYNSKINIGQKKRQTLIFLYIMMG